MATHTPGPWESTPGEDNDAGAVDGVYGGIQSKGWHLASVWADTDELLADAPGNARLMAAAPDLLAALKALASLCGFEDDDEDLQRARAAIEKAEG